MKEVINKLLVIVLFLICVSLIAYIISEVNQNNRENAALERENQKLQKQIDSLLVLVENSEARVDTFWMNIHHYHTKYDTIIEKIPLMEPTEQLAIVDSLTGFDIAQSWVTENFAMIPLPRIERIAVGLLQRDRFEKEIIELYRIIDEKTGQITSLKAVIELKDGQVKIVMAYLEDSQGRVKQLERRLILERVIGGSIIVLLFSLLL